MCCDAELKKTNSTPLIYNHILLKEGGQEKFMKERANQKPEEREKCVQFWLRISHAIVPENYLYELEMSYRNAGWNRVRVEYQKDRSESIYIYLAM